MTQTLKLPTAEKSAGLLLVLGLHGALFWFLLQQRLIPIPDALQPLMVELIQPAAPSTPPAPPKPVRMEKPTPVKPTPQRPVQQLVANAPVLAPSEPVAPPAPPAPPKPVEAAPAPAKPAGPVKLGGDLSLACPQRTPPAYPPLARRMGEEGRVMLRVELDEQGHVSSSRITSSSGSSRLDEAAQAAVLRWRCTPAMRDGQAVRAVALQPFNFTLEGN